MGDRNIGHAIGRSGIFAVHRNIFWLTPTRRLFKIGRHETKVSGNPPCITITFPLLSATWIGK